MTHEVVAQNAGALAGFEGAVDRVDEREVGAVAATAREEAELKGAIFLARQYPRNEAQAYTAIMNTCKRPGFAEQARYSFPRGNQTVAGPSINMARELARRWGNIRFGLRVVGVDDDMVHIRGYAYDLETNLLVEHEDKFARLIYRRSRGWIEPDERDLRELVNRRGAILVRNAILQVVPTDVVEDAMRAVGETLTKAAAGDIEQSREQAVRRLTLAFDAFGVTTEMLEEHLGNPLDAITPEQLADLRGVYRSINDGNTRRQDHFGTGADAPDSEANKDLNEALASDDGGEGDEFAEEPWETGIDPEGDAEQSTIDA